MNEAKIYDIKIYKGEDFSLIFTARDELGTLIDLTGSVVTAQLRQYPSGTNVTDFTCRHNNTGGKITVTMPKETTARIAYTYGTYDVTITFPNTSTSRVLTGKVFILADTTRIPEGTAQIILAFNTFDEFPVEGNIFRLYLDIENALLYRWNGTQYVNALEGLRGFKGDDGNGIAEIRKVSADDLVDTYEIAYTDGTVGYFYVTNGSSIATIQKIGSTGDTDTYQITLTDGTTSTFRVTNGTSISSITKTDTEGLVDTYTITLTNGDTHEFRITNGRDGFGSIVTVKNRVAYVQTLNTLHYDDINGLQEALDEKADIITIYTQTQINTLLAAKADASHTHDDRYYTEAETDTLLNAKANASALGAMAAVNDAPSDGNYYARKDGTWLMVADSGGTPTSSAAWGTITGNLASQQDLQTALNAKADTAHIHDDRYYTETETDSLLASKANAADVYTKTQTDAALADKSGTDHKHDAADITSGTLDVARGGTGKNTHTANAVLTGNGTSAVNNVSSASGAFYATGNDVAPVFGTLPIAQGGTGAASRLAAAKNLTNENVGTAAQFFITMTTSWGKFGYSSTANAWDALGGGAIGKKDSLAASDIPNLPASKITSGTLPVARGGTGGTDSGWLSLTNSSNFDGTFYYRKIGQWVEIVSTQFTLAQALSANGTSLVTLPSGYRPPRDVWFPAASTFEHNGIFLVQPNGVIYFYKTRATSSIPVTTAMYLHVMFTI